MRSVVPGLVVLFSACGGAQPQPTRPPSDYQPQPRSAADGEVLGADNVRPEDKLKMGPRLGPKGVQPAERPGGEPEHEGEVPRPCEEIGRQTPDGQNCPPNAASPKP